MNFTIDVERIASVIRLCVIGDIDLSTVGQLDRAITEALRAGAASLIVDLTATTFCDCTGIAALFAGRRTAAAHGIAYQVINPTGLPAKIMLILDPQNLLTTRTP